MNLLHWGESVGGFLPNPNHMKVLVFGEILWDIIDGEPHLGGAPLNFAAHVCQCGSPAAIVSCVGEDELGNKAVACIEQSGVTIEHIQKSEIKTGTVPVTFVDGQPDYEILRDVAFDYIDEDLLQHEKLKEYDVFYFGSLIQRSGQSGMALTAILNKHRFSEIFYDVNLRKECYSLKIIEYSLSYATILKVNDEEVKEIGPMLFGEDLNMERFCEEIVRKYAQVKIIVITAGANGAYVWSSCEWNHVPTKPIKVEDTVGAGDAFSAAFLCAYELYKDPVKAASIANEVGAFVASSKGAIPQYSQELLGFFEA